ncbi:MAG: cytochrome P460 family protein [Proteobacteria bacterium]|nr:cytochrome P460 family protein [Pseudomonadota bacterium]
MAAAYARSKHPIAVSYRKWQRFSNNAYTSETHGNRHVMNYADNATYGKYDDVKVMPVGSKIAKPSFVVEPDGKVGIGPLFTMEKMAKGFNAASDDWRYAMIMASGAIAGTTKGKGSEVVEFCIGCHKAAEKQDNLFFMPSKYRVSASKKR